MIRPATLQDANAIAEVHVQAWRDAYEGQLPKAFLDSLDVEQRRVMWRRILARPNGVWVAVSGDEIVGFVNAGDGELYAIYLVGSAWDKGLGHALHEEAVGYLRAGGFDEAVLWVLDTNGRAKRFYLRHGWAPDGATKIDGILHEERWRRSL